MISQSAPGKLYVAGEYAVVEAGHQAVLVAVDRLVTVRVAPAERVGSISSALYDPRRLRWHRRPGDGVVEVEGRPGERPGDHREDYVVLAIRLVEQLVREAGGSLRFFDLEVSSGLDDGTGRKLGLGSSAAVTVATVRAVARLYGLALDHMAVYKTALLATDSLQPCGSGGDVAASTFAGWVAYTSPDRGWVRQARGRMSTSDLIHTSWPYLEVRRLPQPDLRLCVGWTGTPASTPRLVARVQDSVRSTAGSTAGSTDAGYGSPRRASRPASSPAASPATGPATSPASGTAYTSFLRGSQACVGALVRALEDNDLAGIRLQVETSRGLLADLSRTSGITIETPRLRRLVEIAQGLKAAAKSSGAGGGDCGIALCPPGTDPAAVRAAWELAGIRPLDLSVCSRPPESL